MFFNSRGGTQPSSLRDQIGEWVTSVSAASVVGRVNVVELHVNVEPLTLTSNTSESAFGGMSTHTAVYYD